MAAIEKGFAGPKDSRGKQVYPGFFYDTGIAAQGGGIPGLLNPGTSPVGGPVAAVTQDVDAEAAVADNNPVSRIGDSSSWVNLNSFSSHGGKLIFYHGVSDPWFSAKDTVDYYQRVAAASGGEAKLKGWSRLFLSPGMGHCGGGSATLDTFDMLSASVAWVEKGQAPQSVIATGRAFPGRSRPPIRRMPNTRDRAVWKTPRTLPAGNSAWPAWLRLRFPAPAQRGVQLHQSQPFVQACARKTQLRGKIVRLACEHLKITRRTAAIPQVR